jgi:opacity protein-like surface antigen
MNKGQFVAVALMLVVGAAAAPGQINLDIGVSGAGVFSKTTSSPSGIVTDSPTDSVAVLGTVRYHFNHLHAVELNFGHTRNSQIFALGPDTYRIMTAIGEYSGAYVLTPFNTEKWQPFLLAGAGALHFGVGNTYIDTIQVNLGATSQTAVAFLYGGGTDYRMLKHLSFRLQYRGLIYKNPDFGVLSRFYTGARGHLAEPAAGIVFKF